MIRLIIVGTGFPDVLNIIESINKKEKIIHVLGFLDDNKKLIGKKVWGYKVLGKISWLKNKKKVFVVNSVARNCKIRDYVFKKIKKYTKNFYNLIDPTVSATNVKLSKGIIINKGVTLGYGSNIGFGSILSWDSHLGHDATVGKNCFLAKGATILGNAKIGDRVFLGSNCSILPKIKIGSDCNIFSNSATINNLSPNSFFVGNNKND